MVHYYRRITSSREFLKISKKFLKFLAELKTKIRYISKLWIFDHNLDLRSKFGFCDQNLDFVIKIWTFDQIINFPPKFLAKTFDSRPQLWFSTKIYIFDKKNRFSIKMLIFDQIFDFRQISNQNFCFDAKFYFRPKFLSSSYSFIAGLAGFTESIYGA